MKLWLDDVRKPPSRKWTWVKTYESAVLLLKTNQVSVISLDHDLGTVKTGYDVACWIEEKYIAKQLIAPKIECHSDNPAGIKKIRQVAQVLEREAVKRQKRDELSYF